MEPGSLEFSPSKLEQARYLSAGHQRARSDGECPALRSRGHTQIKAMPRPKPHSDQESQSELTQSCPTLCDRMDCSLPGSSVYGIFPGKSTGVGCHRLLHAQIKATPRPRPTQSKATPRPKPRSDPSHAQCEPTLEENLNSNPPFLQASLRRFLVLLPSLKSEERPSDREGLGGRGARRRDRGVLGGWTSASRGL